MDHIKHPILKHLHEQSTPEEQAELPAWLQQIPAAAQLLNQLQDEPFIFDAVNAPFAFTLK